MINQTLDKLNSMKLRAMEQEYRRQVELPASAALSFDDRLAMMVDTEWLAKANNRLQRFLREANLREAAANLEDLNFDVRRCLDKAVIGRLADCGWLKKAETLSSQGQPAPERPTWSVPLAMPPAERA